MRTDDGPRHAPARRLFFALWPEARVRAGLVRAVDGLLEGHPRAGRRVNPERYHLTLQFLGEIAPDAWDATLARVGGAAATVRSAAFELVLDEAGSFGGARVWWLGTTHAPDGLRVLWQALDEALRAVGQPLRAEHGFSPHLTVLRDARRRLAPTPVAPVRWPVADFVLVDSQPPAPYKVLARWPLVPVP